MAIKKDILNEVSKLKVTPMQGFIDFIREQGVIGLAVGFILGGSVSKVVTALVNDIINPLLGVFLGKVGTLKEQYLQIGSSKLLWGDFVSTLVDFVIIASVVYLGVKSLGIDKLDKRSHSYIIQVHKYKQRRQIMDVSVFREAGRVFIETPGITLSGKNAVGAALQIALKIGNFSVAQLLPPGASHGVIYRKAKTPVSPERVVIPSEVENDDDQLFGDAPILTTLEKVCSAKHTFFLKVKYPKGKRPRKGAVDVIPLTCRHIAAIREEIVSWSFEGPAVTPEQRAIFEGLKECAYKYLRSRGMK